MNRFIAVFLLFFLTIVQTQAISILSGACTYTSEQNLAHYEQVEKEYSIFERKYHTVKYSGLDPIVCIKVTDEWQNGADAVIEDGGIGRNYVTIQLESRLSRGFLFKVQIFTEKKDTYQDVVNFSSM